MSTAHAVTPQHPDVARARSGDDAAFERIVAPLRRELHAHCYRMLGSAHDADDALQDAMLRAWRGVSRFEGRSTMRSWLYTVATRTCLDSVERRGRRAMPIDLGPSSDRAQVGDVPLAEVDWLGPYPDADLGDGPFGPGGRVEQREAVELAFVAALQHLPGNQRAALLLFEVLGFSAAEIAETMDTSVASVNSALQRARKIVAEKVPERSQQRTLRDVDDAEVRDVVARWSAALERGDADALVAMFTEDVTWSMPPLGGWYRGLEAVMDFATTLPLAACGSWRTLPTTANGQPAIATYLRPPEDGPTTAAAQEILVRPEGVTGEFLPWSINVLSFRGDRVCEVTSFIGPEYHARFGLPASQD